MGGNVRMLNSLKIGLQEVDLVELVSILLKTALTAIFLILNIKSTQLLYTTTYVGIRPPMLHYAMQEVAFLYVFQLWSKPIDRIIYLFTRRLMSHRYFLMDKKPNKKQDIQKNIFTTIFRSLVYSASQSVYIKDCL